VTHQKRGREVLYSLESRRLADARDFIDGISASWDRRIERLRQIVEEPPHRPTTRERRRE
jgi:hypothetical protein